MIKLGPDGKEGIRIWAKNYEDTQVCGATGNCDIWVFDPKTGDLLLSANGFDFLVQTSVHYGLFDIVIRANMGGGSAVRDEYRFDGRKYQHVRQTDESH
jgi:hypothetical protein